MSILQVSPRRMSFYAAAIFLLSAFTTGVSMAVPPMGRDHYEIYCNGRLLVRQVALRGVSLQSLPLEQENSRDELIIYYDECGAAATAIKGRTIILQDGKGKALKEWRFTNATTDERRGMSIPIKELLHWQQSVKDQGATLCYRSEARPEGQALAKL